MKIYQYVDYDAYVASQKHANEIKVGRMWYVKRSTIDQITEHEKQADKKDWPKKILCHGTRSGEEQKWFKEDFPNAYVIGSEIGDSAWRFDMTVQWDFQKVKEDWVNKFDIVYSNSIDHSIYPVETLKIWKDQMVEDGTMYLEYSHYRSRAQPNDPLEADHAELQKYIIAPAGLEIVGKITRDVKAGGIVYILKKAS